MSGFKSVFIPLVFMIYFVNIIGVNAQNQSPSNAELIDNFNKNYLTYPQEKLHVTTDRDIYSSGQNIWLKVYSLEQSSNIPFQLSRVIRVELFDQNQNLVNSLKILNNKGFCKGQIYLHDSLKTGSYLLRAYTNYMLNYDSSKVFRKTITVLNNNEINNDKEKKNYSDLNEVKQPDIQFFPEGGNLIGGVYSKIAFKGINQFGLGFPFEVKIKDQNNKVYAKLSSDSMGFGSFIFKAEYGHKYEAELMYNQKIYKYSFPQVLKESYSIKAILANEQWRVEGHYFSETNKPSNFQLIVHADGKLIGVAQSANNKLISIIPLESLPEGVITLNLIDMNGNIVAERLIFIEPKNRELIKVLNHNKVYKHRERVNLEILINSFVLKDTANVSLSIARPLFFNDDGYNYNIYTNLLLESNLHGFIENPKRFFDPQNKNRLQEVDLLMLTQGWAVYHTKNLDKPLNKKLYNIPEKGLEIQGRVTNFFNDNRPVEGTVSLSFFENLFFQKEVKTNENGEFYFKNLVFYDTMNSIIQSRKKHKKERAKDKKDPVKIEIYPEKPLPYSTLDQQYNSYKIKAELSKQYLETVSKIQLIDSAYFAKNKIIVLEGVEIKSKKINKLTEGRNMLYNNPSNRLILDSIPGSSSMNLDNLLRRIPGVRVNGIFPFTTVSIRGINSITRSSNALIIVDGMFLDYEYASTIPITDIEFVDVLKGASASIYGSRGGNGVVAVYTRRGSSGLSVNDRAHWGIDVNKIIGFQKPDQFYVPNYVVEKPEHIKPDFRTTLYWEPEIIVSPGNSKFVEFYTSDESSEYLIKIEGVSQSGRVIHAVYNLIVE